MIDINDIIKATGLQRPFIYRCLREMKEILNPYISTGKNNRKLFNEEILIFFDRIKQDKEQGITIPTIRKKLLNDLDQLTNKTSQTAPNQIDKKQEESFHQNDSEMFTSLQTTQKQLHQSEMEKREMEYQLNSIKKELKLLPAPDQIKTILNIVYELEDKSKPKFLEGRSVKRLFKDLKNLLIQGE
jgi:DNA-binding transcriptional MerR regulator